MMIPIEICAPAVIALATACAALWHDGRQAKKDLVDLLMKINNLKNGD